MTPAEGLAIARARIAEEARARTGFLDLGMLSLTEWPEELWELGHLEGLNLGSYYHDQNGAFCESEGAGEDNQLRPQGTQWQKLRRLIRLFSHGIPTWDVLTGLEKLTVLQSLNCSNTGVSSLEPLTRLTALQSLDCHGTRISGLEPLAGMTTLKSLNCSWTKANSLEPLADLAALQSLVCIQTKVSSLDPLAGLTALQSIECSYTDVSNLEPLAGLTALESLHCFRCPIAAIPHWLSHEQRPALEELILGNGQAISGVDPKVLSQSYTDNCLPRLRAHFRDLAAGSEALPDIKLIVLGNGRIGKTQICNRLRGQDFEPQADSTHGIVVTTQDFGADTLLRMWDFGGQDIYHGTHALFMRTRAIFLLVWTPQAEDTAGGGQRHARARRHDLPQSSAGLVAQLRASPRGHGQPCPHRAESVR